MAADRQSRTMTGIHFIRRRLENDSHDCCRHWKATGVYANFLEDEGERASRWRIRAGPTIGYRPSSADMTRPTSSIAT
jgi:hypothetical protein